MTHELCTLILAAGEGRRLAQVTGGVPKQFWRLPGERTLLEATVDRFAPLASRARTALVIGRGQEPHLQGSSASAQVGSVVVQPRDRGTAAGVLLGLMPFRDVHPDAPIVITPSDHGVGEQLRFRTMMLAAARHVAVSGDVVVVGAEPDAPCADYGWITPGGDAWAMGPIRPLAAFVEKPASDVARQLFASGSIWNTMIVIARAGALRRLLARQVPELYAGFEGLDLFADDERIDRIADFYEAVPRAYDFSRDVLAPARGLATCILPASIGWTDLGTPDRLRRWYRQPARADLRPSASVPSSAAASA